MFFFIHTELQCTVNHTSDSFFTFSLGHLPSEPGCSERRTWGKFPPGYIHHGVTICRKVVTQYVGWLMLETYWRGVYCLLQTNELQKEIWKVSEIKNLFSLFNDLLTVHPCIICFKLSQLGAHYLLVYLFQLLYMFRATMCPSSEELTLSMRYWYFSLFMDGQQTRQPPI